MKIIGRRRYATLLCRQLTSVSRLTRVYPLTNGPTLLTDIECYELPIEFYCLVRYYLYVFAFCHPMKVLQVCSSHVNNHATSTAGMLTYYGSQPLFIFAELHTLLSFGIQPTLVCIYLSRYIKCMCFGII